MNRLTDSLIAAFILVAAASAGLVLRFQWGLETRDAGYLAIAIACACFVIQFWRGRGGADSGDLDVIAARLDAVRGDIDGFGRRIAAIEGNMARRGRDELGPLVAEVEVLGSLLRQVTEAVADLETKHQSAAANPPPAPSPVPAAPPASPRARVAPPAVAARAPAREEIRPVAHIPKRFAAIGEKGLLNQVRQAIEANRIDIYLQPIVTLPQRKVRFYECFSRLRTDSGDTIYPTDYMDLASARGVLAGLDNQILIRTVHLLKRLSGRAEDVGMFCNISAASLSSPVFFKEIMAFLDSNRSLSSVLIFEMSQRAVQALGPVEQEALSALAEMGFRLSMDQVSDLKAPFTSLSGRGFRYVKVAANRMLNRGGAAASDIHAADLANHFARFGLELIVDHVEAESEVVDLLDFNIRYGQGFLFSPPRPVRNEMMQAAPEAPKVAAPRAEAAPRGTAEDARRRGSIGRAIAARS